MKRIVGYLVVLTFAIVVVGCSSISLPGFTTQHPAFAMNSGMCALMGGGIAQAMSSSVPIINAVTAGAVAACNAEASLVAGPPAQVTTTTVTQSGTTKAVP